MTLQDLITLNNNVFGQNINPVVRLMDSRTELSDMVNYENAFVYTGVRSVALLDLDEVSYVIPFDDYLSVSEILEVSEGLPGLLYFMGQYSFYGFSQSDPEGEGTQMYFARRSSDIVGYEDYFVISPAKQINDTHFSIIDSRIRGYLLTYPNNKLLR